MGFNTEERRRWFLLWKSRVMPKEYCDLENPFYAGRDKSNPIEASHEEIEDEAPEDENTGDKIAEVFGGSSLRKARLDEILQSKSPSPPSGDVQGTRERKQLI